jgi:hypothetical protein
MGISYTPRGFIVSIVEVQVSCTGVQYNRNLTWPIMVIVSSLIHTLPLPNNSTMALNVASLDKSSLRIFMVLRQNRRFHFCRKFSVKWAKRDAEM